MNKRKSKMPFRQPSPGGASFWLGRPKKKQKVRLFKNLARPPPSTAENLINLRPAPRSQGESPASEKPQATNCQLLGLRRFEARGKRLNEHQTLIHNCINIHNIVWTKKTMRCLHAQGYTFPVISA